MTGDLDRFELAVLAVVCPVTFVVAMLVPTWLIPLAAPSTLVGGILLAYVLFKPDRE